MKPVLNKKIFLTGLIPVILLTACQKDIRFAPDPAPDHTFVIQFKPVVDNDSLEYGKTYNNVFGEPFVVRNFKFYICHVDLINTDSGKTYHLNKDEYFLVNFGDAATMRLSLKAVAYKYNRIAFTIGVDSIRNVSGAQTGALDPANGMFLDLEQRIYYGEARGKFNRLQSTQSSFRISHRWLFRNRKCGRKSNAEFST